MGKIESKIDQGFQSMKEDITAVQKQINEVHESIRQLQGLSSDIRDEAA